MHIFGTLTACPATYTQEAIRDDAGNILIPARITPYLVLEDNQGTDWHDLCNRHPHPFYIAIEETGDVEDRRREQNTGKSGVEQDTGNVEGQGPDGKTGKGHIVSMESDPEKIQISGYTIIGIDEDYGFTFGPGGSVYGKIWDGKKIITPPDPDVEDEAAVVPVINRRQFFQQAALVGLFGEEEALGGMAGRLPQVLLDVINALPETERFAATALATGSQTINRNHPLIETLAKEILQHTGLYAPTEEDMEMITARGVERLVPDGEDERRGVEGCNPDRDTINALIDQFWNDAARL